MATSGARNGKGKEAKRSSMFVQYTSVAGIFENVPLES